MKLNPLKIKRFYLLVKIYYEIRKIILKKQSQKGWGGKIIENLAEDLRKKFSNMKGLSLRNLRYMIIFAKNYLEEIV